MSATTYRPPSSFGLFPPVTKNLLILNVLFFLAKITFDGFFVQWFALWPAGVPHAIFQDYPGQFAPFYPWQIVTMAFLHQGFGHLFFNMLGLWMFGMAIERTLGSRRYAVYYAACVLGASLLQLAVSSAPYVMGHAPYPPPFPTLGASGGVLGVVAAFGLLFPNEIIYVYFFPVKAKWAVLGFAAIDLYGGYVGTDNVAHFAHLGGMLVGALLILYWRHRRTVGRRPPSSYA